MFEVKDDGKINPLHWLSGWSNGTLLCCRGDFCTQHMTLYQSRFGLYILYCSTRSWNKKVTFHSWVQRSPACTYTASCRPSAHTHEQNYTQTHKPSVSIMSKEKQEVTQWKLQTCWKEPSVGRDSWSTTPPGRQHCCCHGNHPDTSHSGTQLCCADNPDECWGQTATKKNVLNSEKYTTGDWGTVESMLGTTLTQANETQRSFMVISSVFPACL